MSQRLIEQPNIIRHDDLLGNIGGTPLIRLQRVTRDLPAAVEVFAKAEHLNPGGSVKDRAARAMILEVNGAGSFTQARSSLTRRAVIPESLTR